jgi:hypothetical protein
VIAEIAVIEIGLLKHLNSPVDIVNREMSILNSGFLI